MIQVDRLSKAFSDKKHGSKTAVDQVTFQVKAGEVFGLLGPNGAGKTTALRVLATLLKPTSGRAVVGGCDVVEDPAGVRRQIGFLSGDMRLYGRLTPRELLQFFGRIHQVPAGLLETRVRDLITLFGMEDFAGSRVDKLSTGMRQRAAIARTVIHDPPVLILDEPTGGLDVPTAQIVERFVVEARRQGKCILYSTHVMEEAEYLCDRIAVIHQGVIRTTGTMDQLRELTGKQRLREVFLDLLENHARYAGT